MLLHTLTVCEALYPRSATRSYLRRREGMQSQGSHTGCTKKIELLLATRAEDFRELSHKIAEMQKLQNGKVEALTQHIAVLEESLARSRRLARCLIR